jgi:hypothetical protein
LYGIARTAHFHPSGSIGLTQENSETGMAERQRSAVELLVEGMAQDGIVCPEPRTWDGLWRAMNGTGTGNLSLPLILAAWSQTTDRQKRGRFVEQLATVDQAGAGPELIEAIGGIASSQWHRAQTEAEPTERYVSREDQTELDPGLVEAYVNADFALSGETELIFNIGRVSPALDVAMVWRGTDRAAFLTAYNPFSKDVGEEANRKTQAALLSDLERMGLDWITGEGRDPSGEWPGEPSVLVLGIAKRQALELGHAYEQNALVWCEVGRPSELILLR